MRGHWLSQTRKLNRHYQSGGGKHPFLFDTIIIPGHNDPEEQLFSASYPPGSDPYYAGGYGHAMTRNYTDPRFEKAKFIEFKFLFDKIGNFNAYIDNIGITIFYYDLNNLQQRTVHIDYYRNAGDRPLIWQQYSGYNTYITGGTTPDYGEELVYNGSGKYTLTTPIDFDVVALSPIAGTIGTDYIITAFNVQLQIGSTAATAADSLKGVMEVYLTD